MLSKTFVMLAAPGMIGKSYAAKKICERYPGVALLENDLLMHDIFADAGLKNPTSVSINKVAEWRDAVNATSADCDALIRAKHFEWFRKHEDASLFVADGYPYMLKWYRQQVLKGLQETKCELDCRLLQYYPPMKEQARRRGLKYKQWGWETKSISFHETELKKSWKDFELPVDERLQFAKVDDIFLAEITMHIMSR